MHVPANISITYFLLKYLSQESNIGLVVVWGAYCAHAMCACVWSEWYIFMYLKEITRFACTGQSTSVINPILQCMQI